MKKIGSTIAQRRTEARLTQSELAGRMNAYGFKPSVASISAWEKNVSIPNAEQFLALCDILDITDIGSEFLERNVGENDILAGLSNEGKRRALEYISLLRMSGEFGTAASVPAPTPLPATADIRSVATGIHETHETATHSRILRLYDLPASAGPGEFLDGESYEEIEVGDEVSLLADFGLKIKGNSMEPRFIDGQIVWIRETEDLRDGEIGIFFLDGNAYCKKLHKNSDGVSLISLNPAYDPIIISEDSNFRAFGKVLN